MVGEKAVKKLQKRNIGVDFIPLSRSTVYKYKKKVNAVCATPQFKPKARVKAESDPRNVYTMTVMAHAFCKNLTSKPRTGDPFLE
jgi:hypothetical protein